MSRLSGKSDMPSYMAKSYQVMVFTLFVCVSGMIVPALNAESRPPTQAFIQAGEHGQSLLFTRLGECYAVTPAHVMNNEIFAVLTAGANGTVHGDGDLLQKFGYDLAILRLSGALAKECSTNLDNISSLESLLAAKSIAAISSVNNDGSITRRNVIIKDFDLLYIRVKPNSPNDQLFKGLSGSLLLVNDKPAGILMTVDPDTGEGRVLRYDRAVETLQPFFGKNNLTQKPEKQVSQPSDVIQVKAAAWSNPPVDAAHRAENLTDQNGAQTVWYAKADKFPLHVILDIIAEDALTISSIQLVGGGVIPKERLPRDFEILFSGTADGSWIPIDSGTYFMQDKDKVIRFAPLRAKRIMLRIYSNWGDKDAVGLAGIVLPAVK